MIKFCLFSKNCYDLESELFTIRQTESSTGPWGLGDGVMGDYLSEFPHLQSSVNHYLLNT